MYLPILYNTGTIQLNIKGISVAKFLKILWIARIDCRTGRLETMVWVRTLLFAVANAIAVITLRSPSRFSFKHDRICRRWDTSVEPGVWVVIHICNNRISCVDSTIMRIASLFHCYSFSDRCHVCIIYFFSKRLF